MLSLLSPRFLIGLAISIAFALSNGFSYKAGRAAVRVEWDKERAETVAAALVASQAARAREEKLNTANQKVTNDYNAQKKLRAADAVVSAGKLRDLDAAIAATSADSGASSGADAPFAAIAGECERALVSMDEYAKSLAATASGLQNFASILRLAK